MKIIKEAFKEIQEHLGTQKYNIGDSFHESVFLVKEQLKNGELLYNTFTGEIILSDSVDDNKFLKDKWYFISDTYDEFEILEDIRKRLSNIESRTEISTYTIFPTTDCNASCFYCFEEGRKKVNMNKATAEQVANFILKNSKKESVTIRWFGGEPLYNRMAIDCICAILNENNVKFSSKMATNGFLFSQNIIEIAYRDWHLDHIQITLDGTEDNYNKTKQFRCAKTINPFKKVLNNIEILSSKGIQITIRLNIDLNNIFDQINLTNDVLIKRFGKINNVKVYSHLLMETLISENRQDRKLLFKLKEKLDNLLYENGLSCHTQTRQKFKLYRCISDNKKSITILPGGEIGLCEHYSENHFISSINNFQSINQNEVSFLRERLSNIPICSNCAFFPFCIRLKCCPDSGICYDEVKEQNLQNLHRELLAEYDFYTRKENIENTVLI